MIPIHNRLLCLLFAALCGPACAAHMAHSRPEVQVGILLFDGVQIIDFAGPYEVFGNAGFGVTTLSHDGKPVTTAMGLKVTPDAAFDVGKTFDVLLVPGGDVGDAEQDPEVLAFVRKHSRSSQRVLSVCTGAFILASSGVLDGLKATTFTPRIPQMAKRYPKVDVVRDVRWVDNGRFVTSAGLSSGMDASLHIVDVLHGTDRARSVALRLEYDWKPEGGFVRSRMADRYLPAELEVAVDWPKDMAIQTDVSLGDERQWRKVYQVATATPADELLQRIAKGMESAAAWSRTPGTNRWHSTQEGRSVELAFDTVAGEDAGHYRLDVKIVTEGS